MSPYKKAALLAALSLAGCGSHPRVSANDCGLHGDVLSTRITNSADKPVMRAQIVADFYQNYRFTRAHGEASFAPVLDPGTSRVVDIHVNVPDQHGAQPMKCSVSRAFYGDNTLEDF